MKVMLDIIVKKLLKKTNSLNPISRQNRLKFALTKRILL